MRTHRLSDLDLVGGDKVLQEEPHFDFHRIDRVRAVLIDFEEELVGTVVTLTLEYRGERGRYALTLRLEGISQLVLPEIGPLLQLGEVEIDDLSERRLEGIRFEVVAHFDRSFRCLCRNVRIVDFVKLQGL